MIPKSILKNMSQRLLVSTDEQLANMLDFQNAQLHKIQESQMNENLKEHLMCPINQKITLIKNEINHRKNLNQQEI